MIQHIECELSKRQAERSGEAAFYRGEAAIHFPRLRWLRRKCRATLHPVLLFAVSPLNPYKGNNQEYPYPRWQHLLSIGDFNRKFRKVKIVNHIFCSYCNKKPILLIALSTKT